MILSKAATTKVTSAVPPRASSKGLLEPAGFQRGLVEVPYKSEGVTQAVVSPIQGLRDGQEQF